MQHMIQSEELPRRLDPHDVMRLLHHADDFLVARGIAAVETELALADVVADAAKLQLILHVENRLRQSLGVVTGGAQHMEGNPLRRLLPDSGKVFKFVNESGERL